MTQKQNMAAHLDQIKDNILSAINERLEELAGMAETIHLNANDETNENGVENRSMLQDVDELLAKLSVAHDFIEGKWESGSHAADLKQQKLTHHKMLQARQEERRRLSQEIHDGPAQLLTNILLKADLCEKLIETDTGMARQEAKTLKKTVHTCISEVRTIIYNLRPLAVDGVSMEQLIRHLLDQFRKDSGSSVKLEILPPDLEIEDSELKLELLRIVQESLNNIKKYAQATVCSVKLQKESHRVILRVIDNGHGFDVDQAFSDPGHRFGLLNMRERVELLNGSLIIESSQDKGTHLTAVIPL